MSKSRCAILVLAALGAMAFSTMAEAQQAGVYTGTTADGEPVSFIVGTDYTTGNMAVIGATVSFNALCKGSNAPVNTTWGFGFIQDIANGKANFTYTDTYYFDITASIAFSGSNATGHIISRTAAFIPGNPLPKGVQYCVSPWQAFSATLSYDSKIAPLPPGASLHYPAAK